MLFKDFKYFLLGIMIVTTVININKTFLHDVEHTGGTSGIILAIWNLMLFALYCIWFYEMWAGKARKIEYLPRFTLPIGILLLFCVLSLTTAVDVQKSVFQIIQLIKVVLLFFYIANNVKTEKEFRFVLLILFVTFSFEVALGMFQYVTNAFRCCSGKDPSNRL